MTDENDIIVELRKTIKLLTEYKELQSLYIKDLENQLNLGWSAHKWLK